MWRKLQVLGQRQSFALASVCAAVLALPLAVRSVSHDDTAWLRDLLWPHQLDPFITFSLLLLGMLPLLLGYFHLGRLGALLGLGCGFSLAWLMAVCAILCFVQPRTVSLGILRYAGCVLLVYLLMLWLHMKATVSPFIRDAQRKMRLVRGITL